MTHVHFVHGFLGQSTDWHPIAESLAALSKNHLVFHFADLWSFLGRCNTPSFESWAVDFATQLGEGENHIVGYSLGGRLALHIPKNANVSSLTLISSHPGLEDEKEKKARREADAVWARRFLSELWSDVITAWEGQEVFRHDTSRPTRLEAEFSRSSLATAMEVWSLGAQKNLWNFCETANFPLHFLHGDLDARFSAVAEKLALTCPKARIHKLTGGHSPLFSDSKRVAAVLSRILNEPPAL